MSTPTQVPSVVAAESQLVPVFPGQIGGLPAQVCDGRTLRTFLENGELFPTWIKDRIEKYGFQENQDFAIALENTKTIRRYKTGERKGVAVRTDYHLCLDMAKELSMVENNDKGRQARRYFIDCERRALEAARPAPINPEPPQLAYATQEQRAPLVTAVRRLVKAAEAKGRTLSYSDAHSIVNLKLGVEDVEHLTPEQIPQAMRVVGELLQTIVLEGEYLPRGAQESRPAPEPSPALNHEQRQQLARAIGNALAGWDDNAGAMMNATNRLRVRFHLQHIEELPAEQLPEALEELERLHEDLRGAFSFRAEWRAFVNREVIGAGAPWTPWLARKWQARMKAVLPPRPDWLGIQRQLGQAAAKTADDEGRARA